MAILDSVWNVLSILDLHIAQIPSTKFRFNLIYGLGGGGEKITFEEFEDGCHCGHHGYWNRTILAILNLHGFP